MNLINVGFGNGISDQRLIAIVSPEAAPVRRLILQAKEDGVLIVATCGRKTRSVAIMDSGHIILSAVSPEGLSERAKGKGEDIHE